MPSNLTIVKHPTVNCLCRSDGWVYTPAFERNGAKIPAKWTQGSLYKTKFKNGVYHYYSVRIAGKRYRVHRLICEAFHPNPEMKPHVDHIDRDSTNNVAENLRWATLSENRKNQARNDEARQKLGLDINASHDELKHAYRQVYYAEHRGQILEQKKEYYASKKGVA